ncbi:MAG: hypothetical protein RXN31_00045 [Candidatus Nanopusillus acidilobi]
MALLDLIDKFKYKIRDKSIDIFFDDESEKLKISKFIEDITPESLRKYIKSSLRYSFPETIEDLYESYLVNTGTLFLLLGLLSNNYIFDHLLYMALGYSSSIIISTLYYKNDKFRKVAKRVTPYT